MGWDQSKPAEQVAQPWSDCTTIRILYLLGGNKYNLWRFKQDPRKRNGL